MNFVYFSLNNLQDKLLFDVNNNTETLLIFLKKRTKILQPTLEPSNQTATVMFDNVINHRLRRLYLAHEISQNCVTVSQSLDERSIWNLKNAFLFSFGIITTLGKYYLYILYYLYCYAINKFLKGRLLKATVQSTSSILSLLIFEFYFSCENIFNKNKY